MSEWNNISGAKTLWGVAVGGRLDNERAARAGGAVGRLADESENGERAKMELFGTMELIFAQNYLSTEAFSSQPSFLAE